VRHATGDMMAAARHQEGRVRDIKVCRTDGDTASGPQRRSAPGLTRDARYGRSSHEVVRR